MPTTRRIAYILAGGENSRFGSDKALFAPHGMRMVDVVARSVRQEVDEVVVVRSAPEFAVSGFRNVFDDQPGLGPLAGISAALADARRSSSAALTIGCDVLGVHSAWVSNLFDQLKSSPAAAFRDEYWSGDLAVWRPELAEAIESRLSGDRRSVQGALEEHAVALQPPTGWAGLVRANTAEKALDYLERRSPIRHVELRRSGHEVTDAVAVEEPLEIRIESVILGRRQTRPISITMRTPGDDEALAVGFLFGEGIIASGADVASVAHCDDGANPNVVNVRLAEDVKVDFQKLQRNFYTTSSCGVCGKTSLEALAMKADPVQTLALESQVVSAAPDSLRELQELFGSTGGTHGAGLMTPGGEIVDVAEDVGRHNAMDKLVGRRVMRGASCAGHAVVLSGRASFELLQKALMARVGAVVAVGAPSSLAIEVAKTNGIALYGFVRDAAFNRYV